MSFSPPTDSCMAAIAEDVGVASVQEKNEHSSTVPIKPPSLPRSWTRFQCIKALEEEEEEEAKTETREDPLSIMENAPKDVFDAYQYHQFTSGTAHPSQVVTRDQLIFIMMYYTEIELFYTAATEQEMMADRFDHDQYFEEKDDQIANELDQLVKEHWEEEMEHYYRDQADLCDIMG